MRTDAAKRFGIDPATVRSTVALLLRGEVVGEVRVDQTIRAVVVTGTDGARSDVEGLREWLIEIPGGGYVALGEIADISVVPTQNVVQREDASRKIDITCNVRGEDLGTVASTIGARVAKAGFPLGYHADVLGEFDARQKAQDRLLSLALASLIGIVLLLHADFRSWRLTLLVVASLPFALIGGVVGAFADHATLSLGSMVGFVTVLGIAARNGILLISHYRHLEEHEGMTFGRELVLRGACERLSPILMTATCAALALLPLTIGPELPGQEIERPMAFVILGGLVSSTVLSVFVLPVFYYAFGRPRGAEATMAA